MPFRFSTYPGYTHVASTQTDRDTRYEQESNLTHVWRLQHDAQTKPKDAPCAAPDVAVLPSFEEGANLRLRWQHVDGSARRYRVRVVRIKKNRQKFLLDFGDGDRRWSRLRQPGVAVCGQG